MKTALFAFWQPAADIRREGEVNAYHGVPSRWT